MGDLSDFLRTESRVRKLNDDGIWELLEEAADKIDQQHAERRKLDKRIHNQRKALRDNWEIIEMREPYKRAWYTSPLLRSMINNRIKRLPWWKRLLLRS